MRPKGRTKGRAVKTAYAVVVIVLAAIIICSVAYMSTRTGGWAGQTTLADYMKARAERAGYDNPRDVFGGGGGSRAGADDTADPETEGTEEDG